MAFDEEAQADTVAKYGPLKPCLIEITHGAISGIILGMKKAEFINYIKEYGILEEV